MKTKQQWQKVAKQLLNAVATWKRYVHLLRIANRNNDHKSKSILARAMFFWRIEAEKLATLEKSLRVV